MRNYIFFHIVYVLSQLMYQSDRLKILLYIYLANTGVPAMDWTPRQC